MIAASATARTVATRSTVTTLVPNLAMATKCDLENLESRAPAGRLPAPDATHCLIRNELHHQCPRSRTSERKDDSHDLTDNRSDQRHFRKQPELHGTLQESPGNRTKDKNDNRKGQPSQDRGSFRKMECRRNDGRKYNDDCRQGYGRGHREPEPSAKQSLVELLFLNQIGRQSGIGRISTNGVIVDAAATIPKSSGEIILVRIAIVTNPDKRPTHFWPASQTVPAAADLPRGSTGSPALSSSSGGRRPALFERLADADVEESWLGFTGSPH